MSKIKFSWLLYYLSCTLIGLILGIISAIIWNRSQSATPTPVSVISQSVNSPAPSHTPAAVTLLFTGDVMLGRSVNQNIAQHKDPTWPFTYVADRLKSADITYINLEGPLVADCPVVSTGMIFCGSTANVVGLVTAGVDIASLANNHATNYGAEGLATTIATLQQNGVNPVGVGSPVRMVRNGQAFTFLSFNDIGPYPGIDNVVPSTLSDQISRVKVTGETLVVSFHWGHEYQSTPSERQISLAHQAIEAGADLIVGAHPHWIQTHELYQGKPIYYSLGNFIFDQEWSPETKRGLVVVFTYLGGELIKTEEHPVLIENYGQPRFQ